VASYGQVAEHGTVKVEKLMEVERYSHVMHISSTVTGRLRPELSCWDVLRAALPAGTVSGAPKVQLTRPCASPTKFKSRTPKESVARKIKNEDLYLQLTEGQKGLSILSATSTSTSTSNDACDLGYDTLGLDDWTCKLSPVQVILFPSFAGTM
jgi:hypothetical protein